MVYFEIGCVLFGLYIIYNVLVGKEKYDTSNLLDKAIVFCLWTSGLLNIVIDIIDKLN